jgi:hypothetical protein
VNKLVLRLFWTISIICTFWAITVSLMVDLSLHVTPECSDNELAATEKALLCVKGARLHRQKEACEMGESFVE